MSDPHEAEDAADQRYREAEERLYQRPRFRAALEDYKKAPVMVVECPNRHHLIAAVLSSDHNWHPFLEAAPGEPTRDVIEGWDGLFEGRRAPAASADSIVRERVRFKCRECGYDQSHTQEHLLELYAVALEAELGVIRLA